MRAFSSSNILLNVYSWWWISIKIAWFYPFIYWGFKIIDSLFMPLKKWPIWFFKIPLWSQGSKPMWHASAFAISTLIQTRIAPFWPRGYLSSWLISSFEINPVVFYCFVITGNYNAFQANCGGSLALRGEVLLAEPSCAGGDGEAAPRRLGGSFCCPRSSLSRL